MNLHRESRKKRWPVGYFDIGEIAPTERLYFERLTHDNTDEVASLFVGDDTPHLDDRFRSLEGFRKYAKYVIDEAPWSRKHAGGDFIVRLRQNSTAIGLLNLYDLSCEIFRDVAYRYTIGFQFARGYRRRGYGTEAVRALMLHTRDRVNRTRALAYTKRSNVAAISLLKRLGFRDASPEYVSSSEDKNQYFTKHLTMDTDQLPVYEYGALRRHEIENVPKGLTLFEALEASLKSTKEFITTELVALRNPETRFNNGNGYKRELKLSNALMQFADYERTAAYQILHISRALAGSPPPSIPYNVDEAKHDGSDNTPPLERALSVLQTTRASTVAQLQNLSEDTLTKRGKIDGLEASVRGLGFVICGALWEAVSRLQP